MSITEYQIAYFNGGGGVVRSLWPIRFTFTTLINSNCCEHFLSVFRLTVRKRSQHGSSQRAYTMLGLGGWWWRLLVWPQVTRADTSSTSCYLFRWWHSHAVSLLSLSLVLWFHAAACSPTHKAAFSVHVHSSKPNYLQKNVSVRTTSQRNLDS